MDLEERKIKEIEHSNRRRKIVRAYEYRTDASPDKLEVKYVDEESEFEKHFRNMKFYSIMRACFAWRDKLLFNSIRGAVALDYCCGNGEIAVEMAKRGAKKVIGIDISSVAIENTKRLAESQGIGKICEFLVMDAEHTEFADNTFDIIHEYGALHHLELKAAFSELARILKPDGKLVCSEALRHNPFIHWYRKQTPHLRTQWEVQHILGVPEISSGRAFFGTMDLRMFNLATITAVPFRNTAIFGPMLAVLEGIDKFILSIPLVRWWAWMAVFEYKRPKKP
jgi:ubiquinone/menaquinone biosynthesis C-methylase UbiE